MTATAARCSSPMGRSRSITVRGSLAQMNVMDLLQSLEMGHKTCALVLSNDGDRCEMFFSDGQIKVHHGARQPGADERDGPAAIAGDGAQDLRPGAEQ